MQRLVRDDLVERVGDPDEQRVEALLREEVVEDVREPTIGVDDGWRRGCPRRAACAARRWWEKRVLVRPCVSVRSATADGAADSPSIMAAFRLSAVPRMGETALTSTRVRSLYTLGCSSGNSGPLRSIQVPAATTAPVVRLEAVHKSFGDNEVLKGIDLEVATRRGADDHRPERKREEHAPALRQPARAAERRADLLRGRGDHPQGNRRLGHAPADRDGVPAVQPLPAPDRDGQPDARHAPDPPPAARRGRAARAGAARAGRALRRRPSSIRTSSPAASSSGSRSPAR